MLNYIYYLLGYPEEDEADENSKRQKYLVCMQIRTSKIKLRAIAPKQIKEETKTYKIIEAITTILLAIVLLYPHFESRSIIVSTFFAYFYSNYPGHD